MASEGGLGWLAAASAPEVLPTWCLETGFSADAVAPLPISPLAGAAELGVFVGFLSSLPASNLGADVAGALSDGCAAADAAEASRAGDGLERDLAPTPASPVAPVAAGLSDDFCSARSVWGRLLSPFGFLLSPCGFLPSPCEPGAFAAWPSPCESWLSRALAESVFVVELSLCPALAPLSRASSLAVARRANCVGAPGQR